MFVNGICKKCGEETRVTERLRLCSECIKKVVQNHNVSTIARETAKRIMNSRYGIATRQIKNLEKEIWTRDLIEETDDAPKIHKNAFTFDDFRKTSTMLKEAWIEEYEKHVLLRAMQREVREREINEMIENAMSIRELERKKREDASATDRERIANDPNSEI